MTTATTRQLSTDPARRLGVFKQYADVPPRYRLSIHADAYADRDVWTEYVTEADLFVGQSDAFRREHDCMHRHWTAHMADRCDGRHPALATPADVNDWCAVLLDGRAVRTVYGCYWIHLLNFYDWLAWHPDYPHVYNPVLMAANEYADDAAGIVWEGRMHEGRGRS